MNCRKISIIALCLSISACLDENKEKTHSNTAKEIVLKELTPLDSIEDRIRLAAIQHMATKWENHPTFYIGFFDLDHKNSGGHQGYPDYPVHDPSVATMDHIQAVVKSAYPYSKSGKFQAVVKDHETGMLAREIIAFKPLFEDTGKVSVFIESYCHPTNATGDIYWLTLEDGRYVVTHVEGVWISRNDQKEAEQAVALNRP